MKISISVIILFYFYISTVSAQVYEALTKGIAPGIKSLHDTTNDEFSPTLDSVFFVLGTLSDYMGRFQYIDRQNQVDRYFPYEKPLVDYLTQYIKTELGISVDTIINQSKHIQMYSEELSQQLNRFYGPDDKLIDSLFQTRKQMYSFLAGVYLRYGEKLDTSIYKIQLTNSPKHQVCYELLKSINCNQIFYKYLRNIPARFILYFEPTHEFKKYLAEVEQENEVLKQSFQHQVEEMMKDNMSKEELEKISHKLKQEELVKIKNAFN
jgi:hypothetical protein